MTKPVTRVGVHEAKTQLSKLLRLVAAGQEIEILRNGEPVARLVAAGPRAVRQFGTDQGRFVVPDDFDAPLAPDVLETFAR
jgi:prevent-host-death family protein